MRKCKCKIFILWLFGLMVGYSFTITLRHTTLGCTALDERSARRGDLYLTTHDNHKKANIHTPTGLNPQFQQANGHSPTP
jgi:hypothetical protein